MIKVKKKKKKKKLLNEHKKNLQNLSHELAQLKTFLIQYFDSFCKDSIRSWVFTLLSSEMYGLSIGQGLALSPMEKYQVFL